MASGKSTHAKARKALCCFLLSILPGIATFAITKAIFRGYSTAQGQIVEAQKCNTTYTAKDGTKKRSSHESYLFTYNYTTSAGEEVIAQARFCEVVGYGERVFVGDFHTILYKPADPSRVKWQTSVDTLEKVGLFVALLGAIVNIACLLKCRKKRKSSREATAEIVSESPPPDAFEDKV